MKTSYVFLAPGFEEIEAVSLIDIMRRAGMEVKTVSITPGERTVTGAHGVPYVADTTIDLIDADADWLILPGGMPGATNLYGCKALTDMLKKHAGNIAAICASPSVVLGQLGLLKDKKATCYPGMESYSASGVTFTGAHVERDGRFITAQGPAWSFAFGLAIVAATLGDDAASTVANGMLLAQ